MASAVAHLQQAKLMELADRPKAASTVRSESAAELLCVELAADGLPMDRLAAEEIIGRIVGPRTSTEAEAAEERNRRDSEVLRHAPRNDRVDLRSPLQVRSLLRSIGVDVPDTVLGGYESHEIRTLSSKLFWRGEKLNVLPRHTGMRG